jgi:hypothetical protein
MKTIRPVLARGFDLLVKLAVGLAIVLLPITSFPLLSKLMGRTTVAPPTILFIFLLTVTWLPVYLLRGGKLPAESKPFLVFVVVALIATLAGMFLPFPAYKNIRPLGEEFSALMTLAVGAATYLVFSLWHREDRQFKLVLQLINFSGLVMLLWSFLQLAFILFNDGLYPQLMIRLQSLLSSRTLLDRGFRTRVGGFTYEPSWQAHILNMVYLPYWLAATLTGYSTLRKVWRLSAENFLLVGGFIILVFTKSRVGMLAFLLVGAYLFYELNARAVLWLQGKLKRRMKEKDQRIVKWFPLPLVLAFILIYTGLAFGLVTFMARIDPRVANLLNLTTIPGNVLDFAFRVDFAERVVYWSTGWSVFARYPLLGVGLGNTGFFFTRYLPIISYRLSEIMVMLNQAPYLLNVKSLWIRLLSETGLVGFSVFTVWQVVLWQAGRVLRFNRSLLLRTLGWMGLFAILAFLAEGFSIDSFALPYLWVAMGLLTAASAAVRHTQN